MMEKLRKNIIIDKYERNRNTIWLCFIATFVLGFIAHGFIFSNIAINHDALNEFNASVFGNDMRIQFGKFLVPVYRYLTRGVIAVPWIIGILSLIYISVSVFLVVKIFDVKSKPLIVLISGIFTTNMAVIATSASFIHDLDCDMLALMLATIGAYCWKKFDKGFLIGIIPCALSLGLYQSYISVAITLIMLVSIMSLLENISYKKVLSDGLKGMGMILGSGVLYAVMLKLALVISNTQIMSGRGSSLDIIVGKPIESILYGIFRTYAMVPYKLLTTEFIYPKWFVIFVSLALIAIAGVLILCMLGRIKAKSIILALVLIAMLPFGMNFVGVLALGNTHDLMLFSIWLTYAFAILIVYQYCHTHTEKIKGEAVLKGIAIILVTILIATNIFTANSIYLRKKLGYDATLSYMTRVVDSVENFEGYERGKTQIVLVGSPASIKTPEGLDKYDNVFGNNTSYSLWMSTSSRSSAYFNYVLHNDAAFASEDVFVEMNKNDYVVSMPNYPNKGSIQYVDDYLVVKLGNSYLVK